MKPLFFCSFHKFWGDSSQPEQPTYTIKFVNGADDPLTAQLVEGNYVVTGAAWDTETYPTYNGNPFTLVEWVNAADETDVIAVTDGTATISAEDYATMTEGLTADTVYYAKYDTGILWGNIDNDANGVINATDSTKVNTFYRIKEQFGEDRAMTMVGAGVGKEVYTGSGVIIGNVDNDANGVINATDSTKINTFYRIKEQFGEDRAMTMVGANIGKKIYVVNNDNMELVYSK